MNSTDFNSVVPALSQGQAPNLTLRLARFPSLDGRGGISSYSDSMFLTTASSPARRSAAWQFVNWWEQPAQQARLSTQSSYFPDERAITAYPTPMGDPSNDNIQSQAWDLMTKSAYTVEDLIGPVGPMEGDISDRTFADLDNGLTIDNVIANRTDDINTLLTDYNTDRAAWERCYGEVPSCGG